MRIHLLLLLFLLLGWTEVSNGTLSPLETKEAILLAMDACADLQLKQLNETLLPINTALASSSLPHLVFVILSAKGHYLPALHVAVELARSNQALVSIASGYFGATWLEEELSRNYGEEVKGLVGKRIFHLIGGSDTFLTALGCVTHLNETQKQAISLRARELRTTDITWDMTWIQRTAHNTARVLLPALVAMVTKPALLVVDLHTFGGFLAADKLEIPAAVSHPQLISGVGVLLTHLEDFYFPIYGSLSDDSFLTWMVQPPMKLFTRIFGFFLHRGINQIRADYGLPPVFTSSDYTSKRLVLAHTSFGFEWPRAIPPLVQLIGPSMPLPSPDSWKTMLSADLLERITQATGPCIYVSMGTAVATTPLFARVVVEALREESDCIFWSMPQDQHQFLPKDYPKNFLVRSHFPQVGLLSHPKVKLFISHCGMGSAQEALLTGTPLYCCPHGSDQFDVSSRVESSGAGLVSYQGVNSLSCKQDLPIEDCLGVSISGFRARVIELLKDERYAKNASRVGEILSIPGGSKRAAELLLLTIKHGTQFLTPYSDEHGWWGSSGKALLVMATELGLIFFIVGALARVIWIVCFYGCSRPKVEQKGKGKEKEKEKTEKDHRKKRD